MRRPWLRRVGDTVRFGSSSRLLVFCGPEDLKPPEGLTRSQKKQLAELELQAKLKARDQEVRMPLGLAPSGFCTAVAIWRGSGEP